MFYLPVVLSVVLTTRIFFFLFLNRPDQKKVTIHGIIYTDFYKAATRIYEKKMCVKFKRLWRPDSCQSGSGEHNINNYCCEDL